MPVVQYFNKNESSRKGIFSEDRFTYDKASDAYYQTVAAIFPRSTHTPYDCQSRC
jgi:hypothetical protein